MVAAALERHGNLIRSFAHTEEGKEDDRYKDDFYVIFRVVEEEGARRRIKRSEEEAPTKVAGRNRQTGGRKKENFHYDVVCIEN